MHIAILCTVLVVQVDCVDIRTVAVVHLREYAVHACLQGVSRTIHRVRLHLVDRLHPQYYCSFGGTCTVRVVRVVAGTFIRVRAMIRAYSYSKYVYTAVLVLMYEYQYV